jgi:hypothetical protein
MKQNRHIVDQIIAKLRGADVELGKGKIVDRFPSTTLLRFQQAIHVSQEREDSERHQSLWHNSSSSALFLWTILNSAGLQVSGIVSIR